MQGQCVVDAVAEECDRAPLLAEAIDDPRLLLWGDTGENGYTTGRFRQFGVAEGVDVPAGQSATGDHSQVGADLLGDLGIVAGRDFDRDTQAGELFEGCAGVGLWPVDEYEKTGQDEVPLIGSFDMVQTGRSAGCNGDYARALFVLRLESGVGIRGDRRAAQEDVLR